MNLREGLAMLSPSRPSENTVRVFKESYPFESYDPDLNLSAAQGGSRYFRKLTKDQNRDLSQVQSDRMLQLASWLYDTNPIAKRTLEVTRDYVLGDSASVVANEDDNTTPEQQVLIQETIDGFWDDPWNDMDYWLPQYVLELGMFGEQVYTVSVNPVDGHVRLGYIDPAMIKEVIFDPLNPRQAVAVELSSRSPGDDPIRYKAVTYDETPGGRYYGRMIGLPPEGDPGRMFKVGDRMVEYAGACFVFQINKPISGRRGRSDLLVNVDWMDAYDQLLFDHVERNKLTRSFIWDVILEGADQDQVDAWLKANSSGPKPGTVRAHNEDVKWSAVSPDLHSQEIATDADQILGIVSSGAGIPKTWLNGTIDVNLATARELSEFGFAKLAFRQRLIRRIIKTLVTFQLDQAEMAGQLQRRADLVGGRPDPWPIQVNMPEIRSKDMKAAADTLTSAVNGLKNARTEGLLDKDTAISVVLMMVEQLGVEVDSQAVRDALDEEESLNASPLEDLDLEGEMNNEPGTGTVQDTGSRQAPSPAGGGVAPVPFGASQGVGPGGA